MPIYEYRCATCAHEFEELVSISAAHQTRTCSRSGGQGERLLSTFAVRVAGNSSGSSSGKNCSGCSKSSCATC